MENKALFIVEQEFKNLRDALSGQHLQMIATADIAVAKALQAGMDEGMNYRDIYQLAKKRMEDFAEIVGKTLVPMALKKPKTTNSLITPKNL
jgi:CheY-specific phosphatase CheX